MSRDSREIWLTPATSPPHPAAIPYLSSLARKMLLSFRAESGQSETPMPGAGGPRAEILAQHSEQRDCTQRFWTADDVLEASIEKTNEMGNWGLSFPTKNSCNLNIPHQDSSVCGLQRTLYFENNDIQLPNRESLNSTDLLTGCCSRNQEHLHSSHTVTSCDDVMEGIKPTNHVEELSPDMEFDDLKIYSLPHNTEPTNIAVKTRYEDLDGSNPRHEHSMEIIKTKKNVTWNEYPIYHSNSTNFESRRRLDSSNFKEIKVKRVKNEKLFHQKPIKVEPSDQSFTFTSTPTKKKLAQYKVSNNTNNSKITKFFKLNDSIERALERFKSSRSLCKEIDSGYSLPHNTEPTNIAVKTRYEDLDGSNPRHEHSMEIIKTKKNVTWNEYAMYHCYSTNFESRRCLDSLNFKEIKAKRVKNEKLFHQKPIKVEPSDQSFTFTITPTKKKFKKKLAQYKVSNNTNNSKITKFFELKHSDKVLEEGRSLCKEIDSGFPVRNETGSFPDPPLNVSGKSIDLFEISFVEEMMDKYLPSRTQQNSIVEESQQNIEPTDAARESNNSLLSQLSECFMVNSQDLGQHKPETDKTDDCNLRPGRLPQAVKLEEHETEIKGDTTSALINTNSNEAAEFNSSLHENCFELEQYCKHKESNDIYTPISSQESLANTNELPHVTTQTVSNGAETIKQGLINTDIVNNYGKYDIQKKSRPTGKKVIELNIGIQDRKVVTKPLKQQTLLDFQKLAPTVTSMSGSDQAEPPGQMVKQSHEFGPQQFHDFKKPEVPAIKSKKRSTKGTEQIQRKLKQTDSIKTSRATTNGSLYSSSNKKQSHSAVHNTIQTTLVNSEVSKKVQMKPKKLRFKAPVMTSHPTSQEIMLKNYTITYIDEISIKEILQRLESDRLHKILITVTFKEGFTLLNRPVEQLRNARCVPSGVMFQALWHQGSFDYYYLSVVGDYLSASMLPVVSAFLTRPARVVCYEVQAVYMLLMDVLRVQDTAGWAAYDPLVGCWLLDPDNPVTNFAEVLKKLDMDRDLLVVSSKADVRTQACDLLPVLDLTMDILQRRLSAATLWTLFTDLESRLTPLLAAMECSAILVDVAKLQETSRVLEKRLRQLQLEAYELADHPFQLNSHQQLRRVLFDEMKLDKLFDVVVKQTKQGDKSTSEVVLCQLKNFHPLPKIVLEHRHLQKIKSTYVDGLRQFVRKDGTVGSVWEQTGAATGRITSKNPNLQAFPKVPVVLQGEEKIHLRAIFRAREGFSFLAADFQQIEFRVFAHFTQDPNLLQMLREGGDIFTQLAGHWLGGRGQVEREKTKRIVYSVMYGAGPHKLAEYLHVNTDEAARIIANFVDIFPCLRTLPQTVFAQCRTQGYLVTVTGRRRLFPNIRSTNSGLRAYAERQAINFLIQGSAADICKAAMLDSQTALSARGLEAKLMLQIHDELVWEVADRHLRDTADVVRRAMEDQWNQRLTLKVPVPVSIASGKSLASLEPLDR